jgi:AcrR family transcriptional regulator
MMCEMNSQQSGHDGSPAPGRVDGRRLRREQGRIAVVDATIDLVLDGRTPPTAEQISERAGVSVASVFRYFDSLDDLRHEGIRRYFERYDHLLDLPEIGEHGVGRRVETVVEARLRFYETIDPIARLARSQAMTVPELDATLDRIRDTLRDQLSEHFADVLAALRPGPRRERLAVVAAATSYEAWDLMRRQGLDRASIARAMGAGLGALLDVTID